ncbi:MAG TPA: hypothetical protein VGC97_04370 [Pyrinomonadaceae bacterium]|jgi:hypothetical protein
MRTVIEYHDFIKKAEKIFGSEESEKIAFFLSSNPKAGKKLEKFGGIRKLEWKDNKDYSIYFHPSANNLPLVIISIFRKHKKLILEKLVEILIHSKIS